MKILKIYSTRKNNMEVYSDLIYEWENVFAKELGLKIYSYSSVVEKLLRRLFFLPLHLCGMSSLLQRIERYINYKNYILVCELYPRRYYSYQVFGNKVPYIIDFDYNVNLQTFYSVYRNCKLVLISSRVAYNYLKKNNCPLTIEHLPLSLSDIYKNIEYSFERKFDVIVTRSNPFFSECLEKFESEFPQFEYVVRRWEGNQLYKGNVYVSNKRGVLGEFSNRHDYISLLCTAKVALYSTPGTDIDEVRFMNHVTPTLFEFSACGCKIISRYSHNADTDYFHLEEVTQSASKYEDFRHILLSYLNSEFTDSKVERRYLGDHFTSKRAFVLKQILKNYE